jgi:hypothetical protein
VTARAGLRPDQISAHIVRALQAVGYGQREAAAMLAEHDDWHGAEVLREGAGVVVVDRDATVPGGGKGAYRRGMTRAVDLLHCRADALARKAEYGCEKPESHNRGCPCETKGAVA